MSKLARMSSSTMIGDLNGDQELSVADVIMIVEHILGVANDDFIESNADIDNDNTISINDVSSLVDIILNAGKIDYVTGICKDISFEVFDTSVRINLTLKHPYSGETILGFSLSDKPDMSHTVRMISYTANGKEGDVTFHNEIWMKGLKSGTTYYLRVRYFDWEEERYVYCSPILSFTTL